MEAEVFIFDGEGKRFAERWTAFALFVVGAGVGFVAGMFYGVHMVASVCPAILK